MKRYILALDEGTTSARTLLYDTIENKIVEMSSREYDLIYPKNGYVEQDANEVWANQFASLNQTIAQSGINLEEVYGIGITNQRETIVVWDKHSGKPIYNAIVWQCKRTAEFCDKIKQDDYWRETILNKTGLIIDSYFSASKIKWILDNVAGARKKANAGQLMCGTIDTYIIYKLTLGKVFVTDPSNASRTMLFNINTLDWDDELLNYFGIPRLMLPKIVDSNQVVGQTEVLKSPITICGIAGDQQSALFGQACFEQGNAKITYGTGCFILMNTGDKPKISSKLLTTIAWRINGVTTYALEGSIFNGGSSITWLRDNLDFFRASSESEHWAKKAKNCDGTAGTDGVYVVPAFTGMGAPYWNQNARGTIIGITRATTKAHITRATLEAMAYSVKDIIGNMEADSGIKTIQIAVDGGVSANNFLMQFQADMLSVNVIRPTSTEATALGAVYLCGLGLGVYKDIEQIKKLWLKDKTFKPTMEQTQVDCLYKKWQKAVERSLDWEE
ncbi:MAG: glycerol kinase GlpK [Clostridia bacterium]